MRDVAMLSSRLRMAYGRGSRPGLSELTEIECVASRRAVTSRDNRGRAP